MVVNWKGICICLKLGNESYRSDEGWMRRRYEIGDESIFACVHVVMVVGCVEVGGGRVEVCVCVVCVGVWVYVLRGLHDGFV